MGTTTKPKVKKEHPKEEANPDNIKQDIFKRAKEIISSLPQKWVCLNRICSERITPSTPQDSHESQSNREDFPLELAAGYKRKREDTDDSDTSPLVRMKRLLAVERSAVLSDIDGLTIALNLLQLKIPSRWSGTCNPQTAEARQGSSSREY